MDTVRRALPAGDYSIAGYETGVAVERKTLEDFIGSVIRGRRRFHKELQKLSAYRFACVVVEASLVDVLAHNYRGGADPGSVMGAALSIIVDFGVPVFFCGDRQTARLFTEKYLLRCVRKIEQDRQRPEE